MSKPRKHDGVVYRTEGWLDLVDSILGPKREALKRIQPVLRTGMRPTKLTRQASSQGRQPLRGDRKGEALTFGEWADSFLKNYSKPPIRAAKTHEANLRCVTHLKLPSPAEDWWTSQRTRSSSTFVTVWNSEFASRANGGYRKRELSNRQQSTRSFGSSGVCST